MRWSLSQSLLSREHVPSFLRSLYPTPFPCHRPHLFPWVSVILLLFPQEAPHSRLAALAGSVLGGDGWRTAKDTSRDASSRLCDFTPSTGRRHPSTRRRWQSALLGCQKHLEMGTHWPLPLGLQGLLIGVQDLHLCGPVYLREDSKSFSFPKQPSMAVFQHNITERSKLQSGELNHLHFEARYFLCAGE